MSTPRGSVKLRDAAMNRRAIHVVLTMAALGFVGYALKGHLLTSAPQVDAPQIVELGRQKLGQQAVVDFQITNRGRQPLQLFSFDTSCGCLSVEHKNAGKISKEDAIVLGAKESIEIRAVLAVRGIAGEKARDFVRFRTNDPANTSVTVELVVDLEPEPVVAVPTQLYLSEMVVDSSASKTLILRTPSGREGFKLLGVDNPFPQIIKDIKCVHLEADREAKFATPDHAKDLYRIELELTAPPNPIDINGILEIRGESGKILKVPIAINVVSRVRLTPAVLYLPRHSEQGLIYMASCVCKGPGQAPVELTASKLPEGFRFQIDHASKASAYVVFRVSCDSDSFRTAGKHLLCFNVKHELGIDTIELPVVITLDAR